MNQYLMISDAAKEVCVESHVLRYWEEELHLPIRRNEFGHRYYTRDDVECFKQIKVMKDKGLQLKAIKMILQDGKLDSLKEKEEHPVQVPDNREEKVQRLQCLLGQMIRDAIEENNESLCREFRENVLKELDYQFRLQEERDEERAREAAERDEAYYQKLDDALRKKNGASRKWGRERYRTLDGTEKKKGHFPM